MKETLVQPEAVVKWNENYSKGSDKNYPNLDLVRLESWFFGGKPGKLLEYGFGCGVNMFFMLGKGYVIEAVDASIEAKKLVESKLSKRPEFLNRAKLHLMDPESTKLSFADGTFDYVTCVSVLSLLGSKQSVLKMLKEFKRVLKPKAKIIVDINGPESDFARISERLANDIYVHKGFSGKESPFKCYCPPDAKTFASLVAEVFDVDDIGYRSHKYFHSEIQEFIVCAHKND